MKYCVLGESLKHTMSPPIHKRLFEIKGRDAEYEITELTGDKLVENEEYFDSLGGYNITIPHKLAIMELCDKLDATAVRYGAVNCVDNKNGVSTGYNTDCDGFVMSIRLMGATLSGEVLLVGCGGVGRMIATECAMAGGKLTIAVLQNDIEMTKAAVEKIKALKECKSENISIITIDSIPCDKKFDLIINATPVGMYPKADACPLGEEIIKNCSYAFDVIYNPIQTRFLKIAKENGAKTMGGMAMLVLQAVSAHTIWDGDTYTDDEINAIISEMESAVERDFK